MDKVERYLDSSLRWNDSKILEKNCKIARFARLKRQVLKKYKKSWSLKRKLKESNL